MTDAAGPRGLIPFVVSSELGGHAPPVAGPAGAHRVDPLRAAARPFLDALQRLDERVHGPEGRALPRWAFFDCAEIPGVIAGFARPGAEPEPVSMVAAVPTVQPGTWHVYALAASADADTAASADGLGTATLDLAVGALDMDAVIAATPWRGPELAVLATRAPLALLTAWTPAHSDPATLTCRFDAAATPSPPAGRDLDTGDEEALHDLQASIEGGRRHEITGPPRTDRGRLLVPVREVEG